MKNGKLFFIAIIFLVSFLCISAVSAADDAASDIAAQSDDAVIDESISEEVTNVELANEEPILEESDDGKEENIGAINEGWFVNLDDEIKNGADVVNLGHNYGYNPETDSEFVDGITINRNVTINGNGYTISGKNQSRIFIIPEYITVEFRNINFIEGNTTEYGGAIKVNNYGRCIAINCTFTDNYASYGGAIHSGTNSDNGIAINCRFTNNSATNEGAMYGTAINCTFIGNTATDRGGAMNGYASNCTFTGNTANIGGAMSAGEATNCNFTQNTATTRGGAMGGGIATNCIFTGNTANIGGAINGGNATNCNFTQNTAESGGAINIGDATNCTFIQNSATGRSGGAINIGDATNCNFTGNYAFDSGGAIEEGDATNCTFTENDAKNGGAMSRGDATDCTFTGNNAKNGGAMFDGNANGCTFSGNNATYGGAMSGGNANGCTFSGNNATYGGAINNGDATNCNFTQNTAYGGGAMFEGNANGSTFSGNNATYGGAIAEVDATDCTFTQNNAAEEGGAIYNGSAKGCAFALNTATGNTADVNDGTETDENCKFYTPEISASDFNTVYNYGEKFIFKVSTPDQVLNGVKTRISIFKNGASYANYTALSGSGWTVSLPAGTYQVVLSLEGYNVDPVSQTITVAKNPAKITASAVTATYNVNKYLVIKLTDGKGKALSKVKVTVTLGTAKVYITDKNGQIKINVANKVPKTYTATIKYAGTANYVAFTKKVKVVVKKATPKLTAKAKTFKSKVKTKKYIVTFKNNKGNVMKKAKLTLTIDKKIYKATTNSKGKATFKITKLTKKGKYTATIKFAGSKYYKKLSKKVKITVKK